MFDFRVSLKIIKFINPFPVANVVINYRFPDFFYDFQVIAGLGSL